MHVPPQPPASPPPHPPTLTCKLCLLCNQLMGPVLSVAALALTVGVYETLVSVSLAGWR